MAKTRRFLRCWRLIIAFTIGAARQQRDRHAGQMFCLTSVKNLNVYRLEIIGAAAAAAFNPLSGASKRFTCIQQVELCSRNKRRGGTIESAAQKRSSHGRLASGP